MLNNGLLGGYTYWHPVATEKYAIQYLGGRYVDLARSLGVAGERMERVGKLPRARSSGAIRPTQDPAALLEIMREEPVLAVPQKHA